MKVLIRALPESGGGLPLPEFFGPFFHQVIVPKKKVKRRFCRPEKKDQGARIGGWGGGWLIRAMPELKPYFLDDVFPKSSRKYIVTGKASETIKYINPGHGRG